MIFVKSIVKWMFFNFKLNFLTIHVEWVLPTRLCSLLCEARMAFPRMLNKTDNIFLHTIISCTALDVSYQKVVASLL